MVRLDLFRLAGLGVLLVIAGSSMLASSSHAWSFIGALALVVGGAGLAALCIVGLVRKWRHGYGPIRQTRDELPLSYPELVVVALVCGFFATTLGVAFIIEPNVLRAALGLAALAGFIIACMKLLGR
jgi:hypothetical protein